MKKEFEKGTKFTLKDAVEFNTDAIVSKTVLNKNTGTVSLFAFDKGQSLSEHTAPFDALVQITEGTGRIQINKENYDLKEGEFIVMPANIPHAVQALQAFKMMLTMIKSAD